MKPRIVSRRVNTGSLLLLAFGVAGAALIHRTTHGLWFPRGATGPWAVQAPPGIAWQPGNPIPIRGGKIRGVWGERPDDVWAWSDSGIMHWDGRAWMPMPHGPRGVAWPLSPINSAFVDREEVARLRAAYPNGSSWPPFELHHGYRIGDKELWALDESGRWLVHFDGARWVAARNDARGGPGAIWLADDDHGWAISGGSLLRWNGEAWNTEYVSDEYYESLWGTAADDVWVVGSDGLAMHFDGQTWTKQWLFHHPPLTSVTGRARDDVWIAGCDGTGFLAHWDGARWMQHTVVLGIERGDPAFDFCPLLALTGGGRVLHAVGDRMYERFELDGWQPSPLGPVDGGPRPERRIAVLAARGARSNDVWAVGTVTTGGSAWSDEWPTARPFVARRSGVVWAKQALPEAMGGLRAIWAPDADDVWVVGERGLIFHFDGRAWTREESGTDEDLVAIHGADRSIWVLGREGGLLRRRR